MNFNDAMLFAFITLQCGICIGMLVMLAAIPHLRRRNVEVMVSAFRGVGLSKGSSVILLAHLMRLPHAEAKQLVHDSEAWADHKAGDEALHEAAILEAKKP